MFQKRGDAQQVAFHKFEDGIVSPRGLPRGEIVAFADGCCEGRIVSTLEGGYHLGALARSAELHVRALIGLD